MDCAASVRQYGQQQQRDDVGDLDGGFTAGPAVSL